MTLTSFTVLPFAAHIAQLMLIVAMILTVYRIVEGPGLPDRVVALDLLTTLIVGFSAVYALITEDPLFLRPAIVVALVSFLGTVGFAYYVEKRGAL